MLCGVRQRHTVCAGAVEVRRPCRRVVARWGCGGGCAVGSWRGGLWRVGRWRTPFAASRKVCDRRTCRAGCGGASRCATAWWACGAVGPSLVPGAPRSRRRARCATAAPAGRGAAVPAGVRRPGGRAVLSSRRRSL